MKEGFGFSPEWDTRWEEGFPHRTWLHDASREDQLAAIEPIRMLTHMGRVDFPRGSAHRYVHMQRAKWPFPPAQPVSTKELHEAFRSQIEDDSVPSDDDVLELVRRSVTPKQWSPLGRMHMHVAEALVGTSKLTDTVVATLEKQKDEDLVAWAVEVTIQVHWAGLMLDRLPAAERTDRTARLRVLLERAWKAWPYKHEGDTQNDHGWLPHKLEVILGGAKAVEKWANHPDGVIGAWQLLYAGDDPDLIRANVKRSKPGKYAGTEARLVYLAGDEILEHYLSGWKKCTGDDEHARMVRTFGQIRDERVASWMLDMAAGSKAKALATKWFVEHAEFARPILERQKKHPATSKILKALKK